MSSNDRTVTKITPKKDRTIPWSSWDDYRHAGMVVSEDVEGEPTSEYVRLGEHLYTQHAVQRMCPSGNRFGSAISQTSDQKMACEGRGIPTRFVEEALESPVFDWSRGRRVYTYGDLRVVTSADGRAVITVEYVH